MSSAAAQQTPPKTTGKTTTYVVLKQDDQADTIDVTKMEPGWDVVTTTVTATSADAAIRKVIEREEQAGTFVAVPARSWKPVIVKATTKTVITLENA